LWKNLTHYNNTHLNGAIGHITPKDTLPRYGIRGDRSSLVANGEAIRAVCGWITGYSEVLIGLFRTVKVKLDLE
jgi:hypothetical protein